MILVLSRKIVIDETTEQAIKSSNQDQNRQSPTLDNAKRSQFIWNFIGRRDVSWRRKRESVRQYERLYTFIVYSLLLRVE
jgi:hypothetical protein